MVGRNCFKVRTVQIRELCRERCTKVYHVGVGRVLRNKVHPALHEGDWVREMTQLNGGASHGGMFARFACVVGAKAAGDEAKARGVMGAKAAGGRVGADAPGRGEGAMVVSGGRGRREPSGGPRWS